MSFQDRQYYQEPYGMGGGYGGGRMGGFGLHRPSQMVKYLLIANCVIFLLQLVFKAQMKELFALTPNAPIWQIWRLITFQFLHDNFLHILFNMIALYFFGPEIERHWGSKRFILFYLTCGLVGGLIFVIVSSIFPSFSGNLVGASGGLLGILTACTILFPRMIVFVYVIPVPIRILFVFYLISYVYNVFSQGENAGGDLCHLGGMATGFVWVGRPYIKAWLARLSATSYQKKSKKREMLQYELDRILAKVHEQGIQSLSGKEKKILQQATEEQKQNRA